MLLRLCLTPTHTSIDTILIDWMCSILRCFSWNLDHHSGSSLIFPPRQKSEKQTLAKVKHKVVAQLVVLGLISRKHTHKKYTFNGSICRIHINCKGLNPILLPSSKYNRDITESPTVNFLSCGWYLIICVLPYSSSKRWAVKYLLWEKRESTVCHLRTRNDGLHYRLWGGKEGHRWVSVVQTH